MRVFFKMKHPFLIVCFFFLIGIGFLVWTQKDVSPDKIESIRDNQEVNQGGPEETRDPLTIEYLRKKNYPGSAIVIEQELSPGSNYNQYIASYQSEGLKIYALLTVPRGEKPDTGWPVIIFNHGFIQPRVYTTT
jgi:hypothetical protein